MIHDFQTMDIKYVASQRSTLMVAVIPHKLFLQRRKSLLLSFFPYKKNWCLFHLFAHSHKHCRRSHDWSGWRRFGVTLGCLLAFVLCRYARLGVPFFRLGG